MDICIKAQYFSTEKIYSKWASAASSRYYKAVNFNIYKLSQIVFNYCGLTMILRFIGAIKLLDNEFYHKRTILQIRSTKRGYRYLYCRNSFRTASENRITDWISVWYYDNESNINIKENGEKRRTLDINPRLFLLPCNVYRLKLLINNSNRGCVEATNFFRLVQQIYICLHNYALTNSSKP